MQVSNQIFVMSQACGCIAELCVGDAAHRETIKEAMSRAGGVRAALSVFNMGHTTQNADLMMLSSSALCNIMADRASVKAEAVNEGAIEAFSSVLADSLTPSRLQAACASALFNLASSHVAFMYPEPIRAAMRCIEVSSRIDDRLRWSQPGTSSVERSNSSDQRQTPLRRHLSVHTAPYHAFGHGPPPSMTAVDPPVNNCAKPEDLGHGPPPSITAPDLKVSDMARGRR